MTKLFLKALEGLECFSSKSEIEKGAFISYNVSKVRTPAVVRVDIRKAPDEPEGPHNIPKRTHSRNQRGRFTMFASKFKRLSIACASIVVAATLCVGLTAAPAIAELTAGEIAGEETTASATVVLSQDSFDYDGEAHVPDVVSVTLPDGTVLEPTDHTASYEKVAALDWFPDAVAEPETIISAGTYRVIVTPTEDAQWEGTGTAMFEIAGLGEVRNAIPTLWEGGNATYTGSPVELPAECVGKLFLPPTSGGPDSWLLEEGKDYELVYKDNVDAGVAGVYAIGNGAYTGWTKLTEFEIAPAPVSSASASKIAGATYTGKQVKRPVSLSFNGIPLEEGKDYELAYKDNVKAGKATVTVKGKGNFAGKRELAFTIARASVANAKVGSVKTATYTGKQVKARPKVIYGGMTLKLGRDYTLSYKNNVKAGKATVTVKGKGSFKGAKAAKFVIAYNIARAARAPMKAYVYTGSAIKAKPSLTFNGKKLKLGRDYTLSYKNNVKAGKATVTVKGNTKGFFAGSKKLTFRISPADAYKTKITKVATQKWNTKTVKDALVVKYRGTKLAAGKDYTLSYKSDAKTGKTVVTVKGKGNLKGSSSVEFKWVKAKTHKEKVLVKAAWDEPVYEMKDIYHCLKCDWVADPTSSVPEHMQAFEHQCEMGDKGENHAVGTDFLEVQTGSKHHAAIYETRTVIDRPGYWK